MEQNSTADTAEKSEVPMIAHSAERAMHGSEKAPKRALSTKNKLIALAAAAGLVCGGAALLFAGSQRAPVTTQQPLYQAQITVDAAYRVHLIANELYPQEWMEEGNVYSEKLTDYIELIRTDGRAGRLPYRKRKKAGGLQPKLSAANRQHQSADRAGKNGSADSHCNGGIP